MTPRKMAGPPSQVINNQPLIFFVTFRLIFTRNDWPTVSSEARHYNSLFWYPNTVKFAKTWIFNQDQMKACLVFDIHVLPQFQSQWWPNSKFNNISNFHTFSTLKNNEKYIVQSESTALLSTTCKFGSKWSNFIHSSTNSKIKDTFDSIINYGSERVDFFKKCKSTHVTVACGQPG